MTDDEIFAGLDDLPWGDVRHCFGPAVDTPRYLRNLRSAVPGEYEEAQDHFGQCIYHLGSRFSATHLTVPFLVRIALAPDSPERGGLIGFIMRLAIGHDTDSFPGGFDMGACSEHEVLAYEAVRAAVPDMRRLLRDEDPAVRAATAYLLAWFPSEAAESVAALLALLPHETASPVIINALIALGVLPGAPIAALAPYLDHQIPQITWAAAATLATAGAPGETVAARLSEALESDPCVDFGLLYGYGEFPSLAAVCLAAISRTAGGYADSG